VRTLCGAYLGLGQYAKAFVENDTDLALLPQLSDADLKELGVTSLGHRKRILAAIAENSPYPSLSNGHNV